MGLVVRECLVDEVEFITGVHYEECVDGSKGWEGKLSLVHRFCLVIVRTVLASVEGCYNSLKRMYLVLRKSTIWGFQCQGWQVCNTSCLPFY